jgi:hypothetical protein
MLGSRITEGKRVKIRSISAFKPNTPLIHYSNTLPVDITQIATDISITYSLDLNLGIRHSLDVCYPLPLALCLLPL